MTPSEIVKEGLETIEIKIARSIDQSKKDFLSSHIALIQAEIEWWYKIRIPLQNTTEEKMGLIDYGWQMAKNHQIAYLKDELKKIQGL